MRLIEQIVRLHPLRLFTLEELITDFENSSIYLSILLTHRQRRIEHDCIDSVIQHEPGHSEAILIYAELTSHVADLHSPLTIGFFYSLIERVSIQTVFICDSCILRHTFLILQHDL